MSEVAVDTRGLSRCWQNQGWHVYGAGPCFDAREAALRYREDYDKTKEEYEKFKTTPSWSWQRFFGWEDLARRWGR